MLRSAKQNKDRSEGRNAIIVKFHSSYFEEKTLPEVILRVVMSLYQGTETEIRVGFEKFLVQTGVHQGSVLLPLLFASSVNVITENAREGLRNEIFYTDDLVLMSKSMMNLKWKETFESKGRKVSFKKTKVMVSSSNTQNVFL